MTNETTTTAAVIPTCANTRAGGKRQECVNLWYVLSEKYPSATAAEKCNEIAARLRMSSSGVRENLRRDGINPINTKTIFSHVNG